MSETDLVPLRSREDVLTALATGLTRFGPAVGPPDWLVSAVWLCTDDRLFLATPSIEVLSDGYVARPLAIDPPSNLVGLIRAELPDIEGRLTGRNHKLDLPPAEVVPDAPTDLTRWTSPAYSCSIVVRVAERASVTHHVACAMLVRGTDEQVLLVGSDPTCWAMVLTPEPRLVGAYCSGCYELTPAEYRSQCGR